VLLFPLPVQGPNGRTQLFAALSRHLDAAARRRLARRLFDLGTEAGAAAFLDLADLGPSLAALAPSLQAEEKQQLARRVAEALAAWAQRQRKGGDLNARDDLLESLVEPLLLFARDLPPDEARRLCAGTLAEVVEAEFQKLLGGVGGQIPAEAPQKFALVAALVDRGGAGDSPPATGAAAGARLLSRLPPEEMEKFRATWAGPLLREFEAVKTPRAAVVLGERLAPLCGCLPEEDVRRVVRRLLAVALPTDDPGVQRGAGRALALLAGALREEEAATAAALLVRDAGSAAARLSVVRLWDRRGKPAPPFISFNPEPPFLFLAPAPLEQPLAALAERLSPADAVTLLKHPTCVGVPRDVLLRRLGRHYGRPFPTLWDLVEYLEKNEPGLDLACPPRRPGV
jgi:hypothetical protein